MTTAITLWLLFGAFLATFACWAATATAQGAGVGWIVVAAPITAVVIPAALAATYFALAWIFRTPRPPPHRIGVAATARLFRNEAVAIAASWPRMALFRWLIHEPAPGRAATPVLLLHGVLCNAGVWRGLCAYLDARGIAPVYTLTYGPPLASIEDFSAQLAARVDEILAANGAHRVALVGHSMGGLVVRAYLRRYGASRVASVMTLGTPHHGSVHAWMFPGVSLAQLRPGNAWLAALNRDEGKPFPIRFVSLWSWHDSMVAPQASARLAGAVNVELDGIGHNALLGDERVFECVARELGKRQDAGPSAASAPPSQGKG
jgi:triacylglycerol esterase/lipase EstA (alpha/beta hydrolase family)